jgi:dihydroflavonol-4-reductase
MIAVTGANGLLGSFIVRKLLAAGLPFIAVKRKHGDTSLLHDITDKIKWANADVNDPVVLEEVLKGVTCVIHVAAIVSFNPREKDLIHEVNVIGTRNVVNACLTLGVKKLIHISSVAALGRLKGQELVSENNKWVDNPLNSTYAESKYKAELEVYRGYEEGLQTTILNPSVILAPADWNKSSAKLFKYVWKERRFYIDNDFNYVDVRDVSEAAVRMISEPFSGHRFIVNAGRLPLIQFFSLVATRFNKRPPSIRANSGLLKILAFLEMTRSRLTGSAPLITSETARLANTHFFFSNEKIKKQLNFEFKSIDETLDWCCQYYIRQPLAKK